MPRLQVSDNHRFLVSADGKPFFWLGVTGREDSRAVLMTYHTSGPGHVSDYIHDQPWLGFTSAQSSHGDLVETCWFDPRTGIPRVIGQFPHAGIGWMWGNWASNQALPIPLGELAVA